MAKVNTKYQVLSICIENHEDGTIEHIACGVAPQLLHIIPGHTCGNTGTGQPMQSFRLIREGGAAIDFRCGGCIPIALNTATTYMRKEYFCGLDEND